MKIKKIVSMFLVLALLNGCSSNELKDENKTSPTPTSTPIPTLAPTPEQTVESNVDTTFGVGVFGEFSADYSGGHTLGNINDNNIFPNTELNTPSYINLFIGEEKNQIGFIYEYGLDMTDQECKSLDYMPKDEYGNTYLYYGTLTQLANNVYGSIGDFQPIWDDYEQVVNDKTDFYIVLQEDKLHIVFEEMSIEELQNYTSDYYIPLKQKSGYIDGPDN